MRRPQGLTEIVLAQGFNSNHPLWLTADLNFFESSQGWIFAFKRNFSFVNVAVEPLQRNPDFPPTEPSFPQKQYASVSFRQALEEFKAHLAPTDRISFVGVGQAFCDELKKSGYESLRIGRDPWIKIGSYAPRGNSAKGIRAARNQVQKLGVKVEILPHDELVNNKNLLSELEEVLEDWRDQKVLEMDSFLLTADLRALIPGRKLYVARLRDRIMAYLLASPVRKNQSFYLEDIIYRNQAPNGCSELLILSAIEDLAQDGIEEVSLGVVSGTESSDDQSPKTLAHKILESLILFFYDGQGILHFRKRFAPYEWRSTFILSSQPMGPASALHWPLAILGSVLAFDPRPRRHFRAWRRALTQPMAKHSLTLLWVILLSLGFWGIRLHPLLKNHAAEYFSFTDDMPFYRWFSLSAVNDWITYDLRHYLALCFMGIAVLPIVERKFRFPFLFVCLFLAAFFDKALSFLFLHFPFRWIDSSLYVEMMRLHQIGGSLVLAFFGGLAVNSLQKNSELLFVAFQLGLLLTVLFTSGGLLGLVENLHYTLLFSFGYLSGKIKFEYDRQVSRRAAKAK